MEQILLYGIGNLSARADARRKEKENQGQAEQPCSTGCGKTIKLIYISMMGEQQDRKVGWTARLELSPAFTAQPRDFVLGHGQFDAITVGQHNPKAGSLAFFISERGRE